ncbi:cell wall hydrolase [Tyzzerella nexilis]|nr:cell wall hydrolase [Coprococcus sp. LG100-32]MCB7558092.1 cell wall hydrolase [[Clostridium] nexile]MCC3677908.1 cell wall hydrolase [[Clostridium] nexile]
MYTNTILTVEERGDVWSKVSSGSVVGYVKNEMLAFGSDAVARAAAIDMTNPQDAKTLEEIAAEEAAKKAAEEEAARKAAEEAARQSGSSVRYDEAMSASADDQTLLAAIIYCEAGNQPHDGKVGVGAVILNRVRSGSFPNSIREVIYQAGQFGPAITGKLDRVLASGNIPAECYQAAADALAGYNPIGDALYFGNGNYGQLIGDHYFH